MGSRLGRSTCSGFAVVVLASVFAAAAGSAGAARLRPSHPFSTARSAPALITGVNVSYGPATRTTSELNHARALGARVVRMEIRWSDLEPSAEGQRSPRLLGEIDYLMRAAAARRIKVLAMVDGTPCWASSAPAPIEQGCTPREDGPANAWPPRDPQAYARFVAYLASRYRATLAAIEIWNEPDQANQDYWAGPEKAPRYAALLRAAYPAIKAVAPSLPVLGGSFVGVNGAFLRDLYAAGIKGYYDGLAVHFYTLTIAALRATHEVQLQNGDTTPLWLDEFGWTTCWPHAQSQQEQACVTRKVQAANLVSLTRTLARTPYVAAEVFYKLRNTAHENFGVLTGRGERKPSFAAVANAFASPLGPIAPVRLRLRRRHGRLIASGTGPVGDFMELEALAHKRLRYRAIFTLDRFDRFRLTLPRALGTRHLIVRVFQYGLGVRTAALRHT